MGKLPLKTALLLAVVLTAGCVTPGSTTAPSAAPAVGRPAVVQPAAGPRMPAPPVPSDGSQAAAMQEVMSELQQLGALDPGARDRLMANLQQTDPALWPAIMQHFRAAAAYRNRVQAGGAAPDATQAAASAAFAGQFQPPARSNQLMPGQQNAMAGQNTMAGQTPTEVNRLPVASNRMEAPSNAPLADYPRTTAAELIPQQNAPPRTADERNASGSNSGGVVGVSYEATGDEAWRNELRKTISALESQVVGSPQTPEEISQHARLRILYMLADRRDEAVRPIPEIPPAMQDFWSKQVFGMSTWLDTRKTSDATNRAAETKWILNEALQRLGESAPLVVRNLAFCKAVRSYGRTTEFKKYEFVPNQEVLLYAEVENFSSVATDKGYHTSLRSSYQILDSRGQRVMDHDFTTTDDRCDNLRRDFFINYQFRLPKRIYPGKHTLQLTIEDVKNKKIGQTSIEFTIKGS
jgi:hypothetical protein